jgi:hypothetical protein
MHEKMSRRWTPLEGKPHPNCTEGRKVPCGAIVDVLVVAVDGTVEAKRLPPVRTLLVPRRLSLPQGDTVLNEE